MTEIDKTSVAYISREMAKLYKAIGSRMVATLGPGARVDTLARQPEVFPLGTDQT